MGLDTYHIVPYRSRSTVPNLGNIMIKLTDMTGATVYLAVEAIASVRAAGPSSFWHGCRSIVKLFDGSVQEINETAEEVYAKIEQEQNGKRYD